VLRFWGIFERTDFGPAGEQARDELSFFLEMLDAKAKHYEEKRGARHEVRRTA
jgi:acyl-[acyl-carrier-protein] desaturase